MEKRRLRGDERGSPDGALRTSHAPARPAQERPEKQARLAEEDVAELAKVDALRHELLRREGYIEALQDQLRVQARQNEDRQHIIENLNRQLLERDDEIERQREQIDWLQQAERALRGDIEWRREIIADREWQLKAIEQSRAWRWVLRYWSAKTRLRGIARGNWR